MASVNKVILIGNIGKDPEIRYMPNGDSVANITLATSETWKDKSGQKQEKTEWHRVTFYRRLAEIVGEYLKKGAKIYVEGRLETRKWHDDVKGIDRYTTEIIASEMKMLDSKKEGGGDYTTTSKTYETNPANRNDRQTIPADQNEGKSDFSSMDDDIPF